MKTFAAVIERDCEADLYIDHIPGLAGAHSRGATLDALRANLQEVPEMLLEGVDETTPVTAELVGTQQMRVA
jgi:predicted RNase H-like HicB family nuclease